VEIATKRISLRGIELCYDEVGRGSRPLLLVHGFTGCRRDFDTQFSALGRLGWTLVPDLRGHGGSTHTRDAASYSFSELVEDLVAFLDALGAERCDFLGHSMGGMLALRTALAHPQRVASLLLMGTAPFVPNEIPIDLFRLTWELARRQGMAFVQQLIQQRAAEDPARNAADLRLEREWGYERYWERHRERVTAVDPEAYAALGCEIVEQVSLVPRLAEIRCPTTVMIGELDRSFLAGAEALTRGISGAQRVVFSEVGHHPQFEVPERWYAAVAEHLRRVRASDAIARRLTRIIHEAP